jgi:hypothetical protein
MRFLSAYLIIRTTASGFEKQKKGKNKMNRTSRTFRPMLSFFHANAKGNGAAMRMSLLPATGTEDGSIMVDFANQSAVADFSGPEPVYPRFDWENKITVKLDFGDLCALLQVLRGECESVGDGKGLFHRSESANTRISFRHLVEPVTGYALEVHRIGNSSEGESRSLIVLTAWEALGFAELIAGSMSLVCFGLPMKRAGAAKKREGTDNEAA